MVNHNFTVIDNDVIENYNNKYETILSDNYNSLSVGMLNNNQQYEASLPYNYSTAQKVRANYGLPMEYQTSLSNNIYTRGQRNVSANNILKTEQKNNVYQNNVQGIEAAGVPVQVNENVHTKNTDAVRLSGSNVESNPGAPNPNNPFNENNPSTPINLITTKYPGYRRQHNMCMDSLNHFNECPSCYRYYNYEKNLYVIVMIMLIIIFCIIIWFLLRDITHLKSMLKQK